MTTFEKVLIANRGEIAVRIARSAGDQGYRTVAVYSEADRDAPHVQAADEAVCIGPAPVGSSYLNIEAIIEAARRTHAQAVHPGYGFLAENADFARACRDADLIFIGPNPDAIELMGNKRAAKSRLVDAGIPCIPGYGQSQETDDLIAAGKQIGFPLMVKAAAGGGGRGMRLVLEADELPDALASARSEAEHAFGNGELILEKAIVQPRHIEIQIVADRHGHILSLAERDCSVQRRHQKVVEEAPSPVLNDALRQSMGEVAVNVARVVGYEGAGTVEFLLDQDENFYFMEMNTRLQVEHGVTELITGVDLVALQLSIAAGEPLDLFPEDISLIGHAVEVRLYAEDPAEGFLPRTGKLVDFRAPTGDGIRVDSGVTAGTEIGSHYDPLLAKIMAWGGDRDQARRRLIAALHKTMVAGVITNRDYLIEILDNEVFAEGEATTDFLDIQLADYRAPQPGIRSLVLAAALFQYHAARQSQPVPALFNFYSALPTPISYSLACGDHTYALKLLPLGGDRYRVNLDDEEEHITLDAVENGRVDYTLDNVLRHAAFAIDDTMLYLDAGRCLFTIQDLTLQPDAKAETTGQGKLTAVMDGRITGLTVKAGDQVTKGRALVTMEAMKMEHRIEADMEGRVTAVHVREGDQVAARQLLVELSGEET